MAENSKVDKSTILGLMKDKFNKPTGGATSESSNQNSSDEPVKKRSLRRSTIKIEENVPAVEVKRSARRSLKDQSVLQTAIARKERSFCSPEPTPTASRRLTRSTKTPTKFMPVKESKPPAVSKKRTKNIVEPPPPEVSATETVPPRTEEEDRGSLSSRSSDTPKSKKRNKVQAEEFVSQVTTRSTRSSSVANAELLSEESIKKEVESDFVEPPQQEVRCLCRDDPGYTIDSDDEDTPPNAAKYVFCNAVDDIDSKRLGCINECDTVVIRRASARLPFMQLCVVHYNRISLHNICSICGLFCSQGQFVQCDAINGEIHHYHRACEVIQIGENDEEKGLCPHCGAESPNYDVQLVMVTEDPPTFFRDQIPFRTNSARMYYTPASEKNVQYDYLPKTSYVLPAAPARPFTDEEYERYSIRNLHTAASEGNIELIMNILSIGNSINKTFDEKHGQTALHAAAGEGYLAAVHLFVQAGAQLDVMDDDGYTPLMLAVLGHHNAVVKHLIHAGANPIVKGPNGMMAIHLAAQNSNDEGCALLLSEQLTIPYHKLVDSPDESGKTPPFYACISNNFPVLRYMLGRGADPLTRDNHLNTLLHWASYFGNANISELLLNYGCDVNAVNDEGDTPLHLAASQGHYECVLILMVRGANVYIINFKGDLPINCCEEDSKCKDGIAMNMQLRRAITNQHEEPGLRSFDLSRGKEYHQIPVINTVDDELAPANFVYVTKCCSRSPEVMINDKVTNMLLCTCDTTCGTSSCSCSNLSKRCWYNESGQLVPSFNYQNIPLIFECNYTCTCSINMCRNRVIQLGSRAKLQLFKTEKKGWGVRARAPIPIRAFVVEYTGEYITDAVAEAIKEDTYLFDLERKDGASKYCIDARFYGNISRFINHSCNPNIIPVKFFVDHHDENFPRIAFFSTRAIAVNEELTFNYGRGYWNIKAKTHLYCQCGDANCYYSREKMRLNRKRYM